MTRRNKFEMHAHDIQFKKSKPSWEHNIETYTDHDTKECTHDWFLYIVTIGIMVFGLVALSCI